MNATQVYQGSLDQPYTPLYALFMAVWATLFLVRASECAFTCSVRVRVRVCARVCGLCVSVVCELTRTSLYP